MKKSILISLAIVFLAVGVVFAQGMKDKMPKGEMMGGDMMGKGMMGGMMMKSMMEKTMVATSDGGIIVLAGNTLTKYDKDLNVIKEVEIKVDVDSMYKKTMEMMKDCPMMEKTTANDESNGAAAPTQTSGDTIDHKSHH